MKLRALDTATAACTVDLWSGGAVRARRIEAMTRGHAEALLPMVEATMAEARLAYADLDLIAATVGPGTFTGLRVGLAAARGLALAAGKPIVGVSTLEALAHGVAGDARSGRAVAAVLDARRGEVYMQIFGEDLAPLGPPRAIAPRAVIELLPAGPVVIVGDGAPLVTAALGHARADVFAAEAPRLPDAATVAELCATRFADPDSRPGVPPSPLYLRPSGARLPPPAAARGGAG